MSIIKDQFVQDKKEFLLQTTEYLKTHAEVQAILPETLIEYREKALEELKNGEFTKALQNLETLRDARSGIVIHEVEAIDGKAPITIRDARKCANPAVRGTESFEMQYLNAIRAGMDIVDIEERPELKEQLKQTAIDFMSRFHKDNQALSQTELAEKLQEEISAIATILEDNGIKDSFDKLNIAKDFQNFNDIHSNIATISSIKGNGKEHTVVEGEVALRKLTDEQLKEYQPIKDDREPKPKWYTEMPTWEQNLCKKYVEKIIDGKHVIPTQLRQIVGMKNAFEKSTAIFDAATEKLEVLHTSKHAGTIASLARHEDSRQDITNKNAKQAQEWIGEGRKLHCNTFNSGPIGAGDDPEIA